ncbi:hypothetical protein O3M35_011335 [Rhynocoris fuscipes]|uniref:NADH dehydrogenase [ubiquinone] 1 alpha subcomplex assembly factor 3 n=1 Tax=Rhynocoris fuscipes TaxID=488301 RepID=A0AAW1CY51_9HEMI
MFKTLSRIARLTYGKSNKLFSTAPIVKSSYDSDGKTVVTLLNQEPGLGIMIDTFSQAGFRLNNGMFVLGPMIVFPKTVLSWNIEGDHEINEKSLVLFSLLEPKLDILIIGYGNTTVDRPKFDQVVMNLRRRRRFQNIEILPTDKAASTYNFIAAEGRFVAAALVPPLEVTLYDEDAVTKLKRKDFYSED